jgi:hypothetical protein
MKSILLTSTALVACAGAAAADGHASVSHALGATLGYNNEVDAIGEDGFFWEGNLKTTATAALDNGLTAGGYFEITIGEDGATAGDDGGQALSSSDFVVSLESDTASLFFGDTGQAADKRWASAGDMEADGFASGAASSVLRGDVSFGGVDASISYLVDDANNTAEQLSFGAAATFGIATLTAAYQESTTYVDGDGDASQNEVLGVSAAVTLAGATVTLAYADNQGTDAAPMDIQSTGIKVSYPFGPVVGEIYYVDEGDADANLGVKVTYESGPIAASVAYRDEQGRTEYNVEGSFDAGNGLKILAGALNENEGDDVDFYAGAEYALGGGATASVVYAADEDGDQGDEIGSGEYDPGLTVQIDFTF